MFFVYILKNLDTDRYYIGSSGNLTRRLREHKNGRTRTTRVLETYSLVYKEEFLRESEARKREKQLKSYKSKKYLKWLINKNKGR